MTRRAVTTSGDEVDRQVLADLPVAAVIDELAAALIRGRRVVLQAPPGSGKTTLVPPALLERGLSPGGEVVVLQPRRVAARTVARRLAAILGEPVGATVGYQVRFDTCASARTRIRVVTEGILTAWLQRDPSLEGVGAVVLDEFHERSLHADLALAFVREVQDALRPDLRLVVMSATLDAAPVASFLGGCAIVTSDGRLHPVDVHHLPRPAAGPLAADVAAGILATLDATEAGDVLVFLPGVREIEAARGAVAAGLARRGVDIAVLHGRLGPEAQDAALVPGPRRRVVLATNLAETSLTIANVGAVVDSGLVKVMRHEPALGTGRLETERVSLASAAQRAGRAGRLGPGRALRLWTVHEERTLAAHDDPEIRRVDLAPAVLELLAWGAASARDLPLLEAPDEARLGEAEQTLLRLGAIDADTGRLTPLGQRLRQVPAHPRLAAFLLAAAAEELAEPAARWVAALEGAGRGGQGDIAALARDVGDAPTGAALTRQLARVAADAIAERGSARRSRRPDAPSTRPPPDVDAALARLLLAGFSDRVARRRAPGADAFVLVGGRGARVVAGDDRHAELVVALDVDGGRRGAWSESRVRVFAPLAPADLDGHPALVEEVALSWDAARERVVASRERRLYDLVLERAPIPLSDREAAAALLVERARLDPVGALGTLTDGSARALARLSTLARVFPELALPATAEEWLSRALPALCEGRSALSELRGRDLGPIWLEGLDWALRRRLDAELPERLEVPSGSRIRLEYALDGPPVLPVKVQELFGLERGPRVASGRLACLLHLLDPAGRPLQVTSDLESFWTRTWPEVRAQMRSRYPKHRWPEDPRTATPTQRTTQRRGR